MEFWKDLIKLKESKKPSDKFLRVWAKNQLRFENFEKILKFTCKNLNGILIFYPFFSHFPELLILYTSVKYQNVWRWPGGAFRRDWGVLYSWGGSWGLYKSLTIFGFGLHCQYHFASVNKFARYSTLLYALQLHKSSTQMFILILKNQIHRLRWWSNNCLYLRIIGFAL